MDDQARVTWEKITEDQFQKILQDIPDLIRGIAETRVAKKAENLVRQDKRLVITQKDMIDAFFAETPPGFVGAMKSSMEELGIDYTRFGYK